MVIESRDAVIPDGGVEIQTEFDETEAPTQAIVRGIAALKNVDVTDLEPLYARIDTEALNRLLRRAVASDCYVAVKFTVDEYTVEVSGDRRVRIHDDAPATARDRDGQENR